MSWPAIKAITPETLRQLRDSIDAMPARNRPSYEAAALVLHDLCRWHPSADKPVTETVGQVAEHLLLTRRTVRRCLDAIDFAGLTKAGRRGTKAAAGERGRGSERFITFLPAVQAQPTLTVVRTYCESCGQTGRRCPLAAPYDGCAFAAAVRPAMP